MNKLMVFADFGSIRHYVGELFLSEKIGKHVFNYSPSFLSSGLELSPYTLPLSGGTYPAEINKNLFNLHPLFADALPDEWGIKVQNTEFAKLNIADPSPLERLSFIGSHGTGALRFIPEQEFTKGRKSAHLAGLRKSAQQILTGNVSSVVRSLLVFGGSVGGARPKFLIDISKTNQDEIRYAHTGHDSGWIPCIIKVSHHRSDHWQRIEYTYFQMAGLAGITVPKIRLLEEPEGTAHFVIERFDCSGTDEQFHMHSFAGILGVDFRQTDLDYSRLLRTVSELCLDSAQTQEIFRRMVFNFLGSNRDDHGKNFSFLMNKSGKWFISPAYDISYSSGEQGLHAMSALGKRRNLDKKDFLTLAENFDIRKPENIIENVRMALCSWTDLAGENRVPEKYIRSINERIHENLHRL